MGSVIPGPCRTQAGCRGCDCHADLHRLSWRGDQRAGLNEPLLQMPLPSTIYSLILLDLPQACFHAGRKPQGKPITLERDYWEPQHSLRWMLSGLAILASSPGCHCCQKEDSNRPWGLGTSTTNSELYWEKLPSAMKGSHCIGDLPQATVWAWGF